MRTLTRSTHVQCSTMQFTAALQNCSGSKASTSNDRGRGTKKTVQLRGTDYCTASLRSKKRSSLPGDSPCSLLLQFFSMLVSLEREREKNSFSHKTSFQNSYSYSNSYHNKTKKPKMPKSRSQRSRQLPSSTRSSLEEGSHMKDHNIAAAIAAKNRETPMSIANKWSCCRSQGKSTGNAMQARRPCFVRSVTPAFISVTARVAAADVDTADVVIPTTNAGARFHQGAVRAQEPAYFV
jgi:hypothetical protein